LQRGEGGQERVLVIAHSLDLAILLVLVRSRS
jgi:hypothetical protein